MEALCRKGYGEMVFKLNPLCVKLVFERKTYRLDDTINATVTFVSNNRVKVRSASLNLVAHTRLTEVKMAKNIGTSFGDFLYPSDDARLEDAKHIPFQQSLQVKTGASVCYSTEFLSTASLRTGQPGAYDVKLKIGPNLPKIVRDAMESRQDANSSLSIERWMLEVDVDVVWGRNVRVREEIDVKLWQG